MNVSFIAAMTPSRVVGNNNQLPWPKIKEDFQWFKEKTMGHHIIMGRKTYESLGRPLPGRTNFVITKTKGLFLAGCTVFESIPEAIAAAQKADTESFVIGGASIYEQALPFASRIYLSEVKQEYSGDCYFPELKESEWSRELAKESELVKFWILNRK